MHTKESIKKQKQERLYETKLNQWGSKITIVEYITANNITIEFLSGYKVKAQYKQFTNGSITSPYDKTVYGKGCLGIITSKKPLNAKTNKSYKMWNGMMERAYSKKYKTKYPTYEKCTVCDDWHNYQTFVKWFNINYYKIELQQMCLDKDILFKGNKDYNPQNCIVVPQNINKLFTKTDASRGKFPIGVSYVEKTNRYRALCNNGHKIQEHIGYYDNPIEAFNVYKIHKELIIKEIADKYKTHIPHDLYEAMYKYEVEITD